MEEYNAPTRRPSAGAAERKDRKECRPARKQRKTTKAEHQKQKKERATPLTNKDAPSVNCTSAGTQNPWVIECVLFFLSPIRDLKAPPCKNSGKAIFLVLHKKPKEQRSPERTSKTYPKASTKSQAKTTPAVEGGNYTHQGPQHRKKKNSKREKNIHHNLNTHSPQEK